MNQRPQLGVEIPGMQHGASREARAPPPDAARSAPPRPRAPPARSLGLTRHRRCHVSSLPPPAPGRTPQGRRRTRASRTSSASTMSRRRTTSRIRDMLNVPRKSIYNPSKRRGDVYDDMDLGFEVTEGDDDFDMDDPNDRRKSQIVMRAQLDEIEKTLAQFSPRMLRTDLEGAADAEPRDRCELPSLSPPNSSGERRVWAVPADAVVCVYACVECGRVPPDAASTAPS
ncbi:hypothetical protein MVEN_02627300 [Mycena venus]|uniref:Uncharacterized protein n=1 Tax=Mycena venus TaxID=2733690 RepID=A0A8H6TU89_9AGAR|nr:hypothetical protein MVEN_02627300 [Mycena venus]